jgi:hypothetical protein
MVGRQEGWVDGRKARSDGFMVGRQEGWFDGRKNEGMVASKTGGLLDGS